MIQSEHGAPKEESNHAVREKMEEMGQLCADGQCPPWIQILLEQADPVDISGKAIKDIVIIPISQHSDASRMDTEHSQSIAWESSVSQIHESQDIYLLKLEKRLKKVQDQVPFDRIIDTSSILKTVRSLVQISLSKIKMLSHQIDEKIDLDRTMTEKEESFIKMTDQNLQLKQQIKAQKLIQNALMHLDSNSKFEQYDQKIKQVIQDFVPRAKMTQLFLAKGEMIYTYSNHSKDHLSSFASLIKAQCQADYKQRETSDFVMDQHNLTKMNAFHRIDDMSSIDGGTEFYNFNNMQMPKKQFQSNLVHIDEDEDSQFSPKSKLEGTNQKLMRSCSQKNDLSPHQFQQYQPDPNIVTLSQDFCQPESNLKKFASARGNIDIQNIQPLNLEQNCFDQGEDKFLETGGFHFKNQTQQVSANNKDEKLIKFPSEDHNGISSYGDIVNDVMDDEFELSVETEGLNKIQFNPGKLMRISDRPAIFRNFANEPGYCPHIDGLILGPQNQNPMKRQKGIENCVYAPITHQGLYYGVLQIANTEKRDGQFTEHDAIIIEIVTSHLGQHFHALRNQFHENLSVKKQLLDATFLSSTSSANQILVLSNKLFAEQKNPVRALNKFLERSERYLQSQFGCMFAQILLIDKQNLEFLSRSYDGKGLMQRGHVETQSVAAHVMSTNQVYSYPPINLGQSQSQLLHLSYLYNPDIDGPQSPNYLCSPFHSDSDHLGIIQLSTKEGRFTDQDSMFLQQIASQLSSVIMQLHETEFLNQVGNSQFQGVHKLASVLESKLRGNMKSFFFELVAIRYGKNVVLKNKILRKQINNRMEIDQEFVRKTEKLMKLAQKFTNRTKKATMNRLNEKLVLIQAARKKNAEKCIAIMSKFQKILKIRVKDVAFHQWSNKLKIVQGTQDSSVRNSQIAFSDQDFGSIYNDQSSILSGHFQKAKTIYRLKKLFNANRLKVYFDNFVLKTMFNHNRGYRLLRSSCQKVQLRNLIMHKIMCGRLHQKSRSTFDLLWSHCKSKRLALNKLRRVIRSNHLKLCSSGFQNWKIAFSQRHRSDVSQTNSMLAIQIQENTMEQLQSLIIKHVLANQRGKYRTAEECFHGPQFKDMMYQVLQFIQNTKDKFATGFEMQEVVFNFALPPGTEKFGQQFIQVMFSMNKKIYKREPTITRDKEASFGRETNFVSRTFGSINDVLSDQKQSHKKEASISLAESLYHSQVKQFTESNTITNQYSFEIGFENLETDTLIKVSQQSEQAFGLEYVQNDHSLGECIFKRKVISQDVLVVPIKDDEGNIAGSIEFYTQKSCDIDTWLSAFEKYGKKIGVGMKHYMITLLNNLAIQSSILQNELNFEMSTFMPAQLQALQGYSQNPVQFSKLIFEIDLMVKKAFRADSTRVIFIPTSEAGYFMQGEFTQRDLFKLDLQNTQISHLLKQNGCAQITLPSSLICHQPWSPVDPDPQYSVMGEQFEAIKYLAIYKAPGQLFAVIEIAWHSLSQAFMIHENPAYLAKKEDKIVAITKETINQTYIKLKLMSGGIKQKSNYEILHQKRKAFFNRWKRSAFLETFMEQDESHMAPRTAELKGRRLDLSQDRMPSYSPILPTQDLSLSIMQRSNYNSAFSPQKPNFTPYKSQTREKQVLKESIFEKNRANQFRNSSKVVAILASRTQKRLELKTYFSQWQMFLRNARLAETAFEQILQMHQKHSSQRFKSAVALMERLNSRVSHRVGMERIIEKAIDVMREEKKMISQQTKKEKTKKHDEYINNRFLEAFKQ